MRARTKLCDVAVYVPTGLMDVLMGGAKRHGVAWHRALEEIEGRVKVAAEAAAVGIIREYAGESDASDGSDGSMGMGAA